MSGLSAAASRAAWFGRSAAACVSSIVLWGCVAQAPASPPVPVMLPPPAATVPAAQPAPVEPPAPVKVRPPSFSAPPAHPVPYAELPHPVRPPEGAAQTPATLRALASLPGWAAEDHLAALLAFRDGCGVAKAPEWKAVCARARAVTPTDAAAARGFFEANFMAEAPAPTGLLTAYFSPEYPAEVVPDEMFSAPVRPLPGDPDTIANRTRAEIETDPAEGARAFMKAEDLFFLQIQGSGTLVFPDGRRLKAVYSGDNGLTFTAIARPMAKAGLLSADNLSGDAIRAWLSDHRGAEADAVMDQDARYIFFDLIPDDGHDPAGAAGTPLTAGRALAVDPAFHRYGALYWIDADAPTLNGAVPAYRRLALALDTGAAIKGERRADLYLGRGDAAGHEAGRVRHVLSLVRLIPVTPPPLPIEPSPASLPSGPPHETPPSPG